MSTKPPLPRLPLSRLNLSRDDENFINDMVQLSSDRLDQLVDDVSQRIIDMDPGPIVMTAALELSIHAIAVAIQAKVFQMDAKKVYGKAFVQLTKEQRKPLVAHYLALVKSSAEASYNMETLP